MTFRCGWMMLLFIGFFYLPALVFLEMSANGHGARSIAATAATIRHC